MAVVEASGAYFAVVDDLFSFNKAQNYSLLQKMLLKIGGSG